MSHDPTETIPPGGTHVTEYVPTDACERCREGFNRTWSGVVSQVQAAQERAEARELRADERERQAMERERKAQGTLDDLDRRMERIEGRMDGLEKKLDASSLETKNTLTSIGAQLESRRAFDKGLVGFVTRFGPWILLTIAAAIIAMSQGGTSQADVQALMKDAAKAAASEVLRQGATP